MAEPQQPRPRRRPPADDEPKKDPVLAAILTLMLTGYALAKGW